MTDDRLPAKYAVMVQITNASDYQIAQKHYGIKGDFKETDTVYVCVHLWSMERASIEEAFMRSIGLDPTIVSL